MRNALYLLFALACAEVGISAATIAVFGTGLNASGQFLTVGSIDPHYTFAVNPLGSGANAFVPGGASMVESASQAVPTGWPFTSGGWVSDPLAQWIAPASDVVAIPGVGMDTFFTYQTTFNLFGFDLSTVVLTGHWTADNFLSDVLLNGTPIFSGSGGGCGSPGNLTFNNLTPFTISSGFVQGVNTLTFDVTNSTCFNSPPRTNPTGLLVDISGSGSLIGAPVPEPVTAIPLFGALVFTAFLYRRRR